MDRAVIDLVCLSIAIVIVITVHFPLSICRLMHGR